MSPRICEFCKSELPEGAHFCPKCGKEAITQVCKACGAPIPDGARFCLKCGKEVASLSTQSTQPATQPAPSVSTEKQQPPPSGKKRQKGSVLFIILVLIIVVCVAVFALKDENQPGQDTTPVETSQVVVNTVSVEENAVLWNRAHTALFQFIGEGMKTFGRDETLPATQEELAPMSGFIMDFNNALEAIANVTPPPEQAITHRALLPIYQKMQSHMTKIRDLLLSSNPSDADLEWNRLAILLDETAGLMDVLSPVPTQDSITTTTTTVSKTVLPLPPGTPPKPGNLLATDAEYFLMYSAAKDWGFDFNESFANYSQQGIENNWVSMWIGLTEDENSRLHFDRAGDNWKPSSMPPLPSSISAKPFNLSASYADYLLMYTTYNNWGYDFISAFSKFSSNAVANKWTSWWMGSEANAEMRLNFHAVGDKWMLD